MLKSLLLHEQFALASCSLLGTMVILSSVYMFWQWHNDWQLAHINDELPSLNLNLSQQTAENLLTNQHLFGLALQKGGEMPITSLQLQITGIVKATQASKSSKVYISIQNQPSKIYKIGDQLPYGVKIYDITADQVILENKGRLEKLLMAREPLQFKPLPNRGSA